MMSPSLDESQSLAFFGPMDGLLGVCQYSDDRHHGVVDERGIVRSVASSVFSGGLAVSRFAK